jgi:hypothetical protein
MGAIVEQKWGFIEADSTSGVASIEHIERLDGKRDISAEIALYFFNAHNGGVGRALIQEVVDADGTHQIGGPNAGGRAATGVKFEVGAANGAIASARWIINFWG